MFISTLSANRWSRLNKIRGKRVCFVYQGMCVCVQAQKKKGCWSGNSSSLHSLLYFKDLALAHIMNCAELFVSTRAELFDVHWCQFTAQAPSAMATSVGTMLQVQHGVEMCRTSTVRCSWFVFWIMYTWHRVHMCVCVLVCLFVSQCHMLYDSHLFPAETHCSMMSSPQRRAQKGKESKIGKLLYIYLHALSLRSPSKALCLPPELQWTTSHSRRASDSRLGVRGCNTYFNRCVLVWACAIFSVRTCPSNNSDQ